MTQGRFTFRLLLGLCLILPGMAHAAMPPVAMPHDSAPEGVPARLKPIAVIHFTDNSAIDKEHAEMIRHMVRQAKSDFHVTIEDVELNNESSLASRIDKIADSDVGLIIIIEPRDTQALMRIPSLYPDIHFSIIGANAPLFFPNVQTMIFRDQEGLFMTGVLAALRSKTGTISFLSKEDDAYSRDMAYAFFQGAKYAIPEIQVVQRLGGARSRGKSPADTADVQFLLDDSLIDNSLVGAREQKRLIIPFNHDLTGAYPGVVLTSLLKHYDLAIYTALQEYRQNAWKPGTRALGLGNGYIDYVLDNSNKSMMSKKLIEQMEMTRDLVSQGIVQISPLQ